MIRNYETWLQNIQGVEIKKLRKRFRIFVISYCFVFRSQKGFTLIELLAVIAIIGVLATYILVRGQEARERARIVKAQAESDQLRKAITLLGNDTGEWPGHTPVDNVGRGISLNEVWDLTAPEAGLLSTDGAYANWNGPFIQAINPDPWGNHYFFDPDYDIDPGAGENWAAVVGSFGPNGIGQNIYDEDNIYAIVGTK